MELIRVRFSTRSVSQPAYDSLASAREAEVRNMVSYRISPYGVNLPCGMNMTCERVNYVCDTVKKVMGG